MRGSYLLIILFCIVIFLGCGGGGGSGVGPELVSGQISGQIIFDENLANERALIASFSASSRASSFDNALVFLEEMPTRAVYADSEGKYVFTDLPLDNSYHIIARINSLSGKVYKTRSEEIVLGKKQALVTKNINIDKSSEAKYQIRLQVKDTKDNKVSRCKIWLWGEEFTLDESGSYLSPKMPLGASGILKVIPPTNKDLLTLESNIDSTVFQSEIQGVAAVTLPPSGITQKKAPYVSIKVGETISGGFALRLYGNAKDPQNDILDLEWAASIGSFTYESQDKSYVDWAIPTEQTSAIISLKAAQASSSVYPLFWSKVELPITISNNGSVSYPGEIIVKPVSRIFDIVSSATEQITGDTLSAFEIVASFPNNSKLSYAWEVSDGTLVSGKNDRKMIWKSPPLESNQSKIATVTAQVSDEIATVTKSILVSITSFPTVTFSSPLDVDFYPGQVFFRGSAKDYLGNFISYENFKWYLATFSSDLQLIQVEGASFTYNFIEQGSYTVSLAAKDSSGVIGTGSMVISILNSPPEINILSPANDGAYKSSDKMVFKAKVIDYDDGEITAPEQITWISDIDGVIGSGTYFTKDSLTKNNKHTITVLAKDSQGCVASDSIDIWYDMPARITLSPEKGAVFFEGSEISFIAQGVDANGYPLASSTYKWYLDGGTSPWKTGIESFEVNDLSSGLHSVKVIGANDYGDVISDDYYFEVGWPRPEIISPASGTRFEPGTIINLSAVSVSTGTLTLNWFLDDSLDSLGTSNKLSKKFEIGRHIIRYEGVDSCGNYVSSSIGFVVEREPQIELNYASGSFFFADQRILFHAICKDSLGDDISDERIKWYYLDSGSPLLWKVGSLFYTLQGSMEGMLAAGSHTVRVEATGPYGTVASKSFSFEAGVPLVSITSPVSENAYGVGENIRFNANIEKESVAIMWFAGEEVIFTGHSAFDYSFPLGIYSIKAIATDSANVSSSSEITISVGVYPIMDIYVKNKKGKNVDPANIVVFTGKSLTFTGSGTSPLDGSSIDGSAMIWTLCNKDGVTGKQNYNGRSELTVSSDNLSVLGRASGTVELKCKISDDFIGRKTKEIFFNMPLSSYEFPASNTFIPFDNSLPNCIVTASGFPESVGKVKYEWYLNWGKNTITKLDDADNSQEGMQLSLNKGMNYLTLVATDSLGQVSAVTKKILVDNRPVLSFSPPSDYSDSDVYVFEGCDITLKATGTPAIKPGSINNYKWYLGRDPEPRVVGLEEISNTQIGLISGKNIVTLTAEDQYGIVATVSHSIYFDEKLPGILFPVEDAVFQDRSISFEATGSVNIAMKWNLNGTELPDTSDTLVINKDDLRLVEGVNTITYSGTDSIGNSKSFNLHFRYASTEKLPKIEMILPNSRVLDDNAVIFALVGDESLTIIGSATGSIQKDTIVASKMEWILYKQGNESNKQYFHGIKDLTLNNTALDSAGKWVLSLTVTDELGFTNTATNTFYYGYPTPQILLPQNRKSFSLSEVESLNLKGNNIGDADLNMEWYNEAGDLIGTGYNIYKNFGRGYYLITYIGTDTAGVEKKTSIEFIVNENPSVDIKYQKDDGVYYSLGDGAKFFDGYNLILKGTAQKRDDSEIDDDDTAWLKCLSEADSGTNLVTGNKNPTLSDSMLGEGTWYLKFKAEDKDFSSHGFAGNYINSKAVRIITGIDNPRFIGAEDGKRVDENSTIVFTVSDISPIDGYWSVDGLASHSVTERSGDNLCFTLDVTPLSRGYHKIYYGAEDSSGKSYIAETSILVDSGPYFLEDYPKILSSFDKLGSAKINDLDYTIIKSENNNIKNLELKVETNSLASNTIVWDSGEHSTALNSFSRNFQIGSYTYKVTITDEFGIATFTTLSFWVWGYETYNCDAPSSIVSNNSSNLFVVSDGTKLIKYDRVSDASSSSSGDIEKTGECETSESIAGLCYSNSNLYSITAPSGYSVKYNKWNTAELATDSEVVINSSIGGTGGFLIKNTKVYICDQSSTVDDNFVKLFFLDGIFFVNSSCGFKKPFALTDSNSGIYVTDYDNDKIVNLDADGNDREKTLEVSLPKGISYSGTTNRLYVAGKEDGTPCVYVINLDTYKVMYSFKGGDALNLAICGTGSTSDLYIADQVNNKIIRLRSGFSW